MVPPPFDPPPVTVAEAQDRLPQLIAEMRPGQELRVLQDGRTVAILVRTDPHGTFGNSEGGDWALVSLVDNDDPPQVNGGR